LFIVLPPKLELHRELIPRLCPGIMYCTMPVNL
jgi:hypothetical protein